MDDAFHGLKIVRTDIPVSDILEPVRLLHITDMHLTHADARETGRTREIAAARTAGFTIFPDCSIRALFERILGFAEDSNVDCVVLTGDIIDFPSLANLEALHFLLNQSRIPYAFVTGNHDWWPEYLDGRIGRFPEYMEKLTPFMDVKAGCGERMVKGVRLLTLDDSLYQVSDAQLKLVKDKLSDGLPSLMFMHIPLYLPSLVGDVVRVWRNPILLASPASIPRVGGDAIEAPLPEPATEELRELIAGGGFRGLRGLFAGHVHFSHEDAVCPGLSQYVTAPGFAGACRLITLIPA